MQNVIECSGHPRDMGLQQGIACRSEVAEWLQREALPRRRSLLPDLGAYASGAVLGRGAGREVIRHFTHLSERIDGLAREARVPVASVMELHLRTTPGGGGDAFLAGRALGLLCADASSASDRAHVMVRSAGPAANQPGSRGGWRVRRSRPEVGFASLEITLPWFVSAIAGINEEGLSVSFMPGHGAGASEGKASPAPPPILLVQECLQRFGDLAASLDWCRSRPTSGYGELLIADGSGEAASVRFTGAERSLSQVGPGQWVDGSSAGRFESSAVVRADGSIDPDGLSKLAEEVGSLSAASSWLGLRPADGVIEFVSTTAPRMAWRLED